MTLYDIDQAFEILKKYKMTTHKESVRRWLRTGVLKGIRPATRKEGWRIREDDLKVFIKERLPTEGELFNLDNKRRTSITTNVAKGFSEEEARSKMWWQLVRKNIFEGFIPIKRTRIRDCIEHRRYPKALEEQVWQKCLKNKAGYSNPRVSYLLEAFLFDGQRILMDENFEDLEEKILFPLIEYVREESKHL